ncbi:MAG: phage/plasmid primase, P4 family [Pseudomonadota bacterium]
MMTPNLDTIPQDLLARLGWVTWKAEARPGQKELAKVPYNPRTGEKANPSRPDTGGTFDEARAAYESSPGLFAGVGIILHEGLMGIDLDDCRDPQTGAVQPWAQAVIDQMATYTEVSPSSTGFKLFLLGKKPGTACRRGSFEMYDKDRFFTVTGCGLPCGPLDDVPLLATGRSKELDEVYAEFLGEDEPDHKGVDIQPGETRLSDERVLKYANRDEKFRRLSDGEWESDYSSRSEADLALCNKLAFYCGRDPEQMDRLFRESDLNRPKWEDRPDYRERTINKALAMCKDVHPMQRSGEDMFSEVDGRDNQRGVRRAPCQREMALKVIEGYGPGNLLHNGQNFWEWSERGVWVRRDDREVKQAVHRVLVVVGKVTRAQVDGVLDVAKTEAFRPVLLNQTQEFVNTSAGELHWNGSEWEVRPHDREHYAISQIPVVYDPTAPAERFDRFLDEVFDGDRDADLKKTLLLELIGYSCMPTTAYERFALLVGLGANGKSIVLHVIKVLLGTVNCCAVAPNQFNNRFQRAHLHGKLANIVTELAEGSVIADAELKAIVSGEMMTAEHKMQPPFDFTPTCTIWLATNHMPHTRDFSDALFRRASVLTFNRTFKPEEQDKHLKQKLERELPGILARALNAFGGVLRRGNFTMPPSVMEAREAWRMQVDQVATFIDDCVEREPGAWQRSIRVYSRYKSWALEAGIHRTLNQKNFTIRMERHGFQPRKGSGGARGISGLRLLNWVNAEADQDAGSCSTGVG